MLTKRFQIDPEVQSILLAGEVVVSDGRVLFYLPQGQLDRRLYEGVDRALQALGGKWNRKAKAHVFARDPREQLVALIEDGKTAIPKDGFFSTPPAIIEQMLDLGGIGEHCILEPSAGEGAIADTICAAFPAAKLRLFCVERDEVRAAILRMKGYHTHVGNFLEWFGPPTPDLSIDRVYINPPFEQGQDIDHVLHAYGLLTWGGILVSVMGEGTFFRSDRKSIAFRDFCRVVDAYTVRLPEDAFVPSGTKVQARLVQIRKS